jgi:hypothetical protein
MTTEASLFGVTDKKTVVIRRSGQGERTSHFLARAGCDGESALAVRRNGIRQGAVKGHVLHAASGFSP